MAKKLIAIMTGLMLAATVGAQPASAAVPEPTHVNNCLDGSASYNDFVFDIIRLGHQTRLFCGTPTEGVIHIEDAHGPIGNTNFPACVDLVMSIGNEKEQSNGNYLWNSGYLVGGSWREAYVVVAKHSYISGEWSIATAYTGGSKSNDWTACGEYARSRGYQVARDGQGVHAKSR